MPARSNISRPAPPRYRLEILPVVKPYHWRARNRLEKGQLVYYGPAPQYYGIGEVINFMGPYVIVDFRGTGLMGVHKEALEPQYLIPIAPHLLREL